MKGHSRRQGRALWACFTRIPLLSTSVWLARFWLDQRRREMDRQLPPRWLALPFISSWLDHVSRCAGFKQHDWLVPPTCLCPVAHTTWSRRHVANTNVENSQRRPIIWITLLWRLAHDTKKARAIRETPNFNHPTFNREVIKAEEWTGTKVDGWQARSAP